MLKMLTLIYFKYCFISLRHKVTGVVILQAENVYLKLFHCTSY